MNRKVVSAVFDTRAQAARAVDELRDAGINERNISVLHQDGEKHRDNGHHDHGDHADTKASGAAKGAGIGAGVGAIAGLTALAIPGVGPFLALGAVAETLGIIGSAAVTSAAVGAAAGGSPER